MTARKALSVRRLVLRRHDGQVYLNRWGFGHKRIGGVMLHRMDAADPGIDLHDHPWTFISVVLLGGYTEERALCREAPQLAQIAEHADVEYPYGHPLASLQAEIEHDRRIHRGVVEHRRRFSIRMLRLDECHRITELDGRRCWTLVLTGPVRRKWGFYLPGGYMSEKTYDETVRVVRRDLIADHGYVQTLLAEPPQ